MKTAVSIPDDIFARADDLASRRSISRSELYAQALRLLLEGDDSVTARLDEVYEATSSDPFVSEAARRTFVDSDW